MQETVRGELIVDGAVKPEWIDGNGHMNVAYYVVAFDLGVDALFTRLGVTDEYIRSGGGTTFAVESHISWRRELKEGERYRITADVLAYDEKRVHQFQRMYHAEEGWIAATAEWMNLHVDLGTRRVSPWPAAVLAALEEHTRAQRSIRAPEDAGRRMAVRRPLWSLEAPGDRG